MQYGFLETRPYSTQLRLKKQDLFNAVKIEETRPFQWCRHRRRRRWERGRETGDIALTSIESIANLLNIDDFRFHEHWYIRSIYWLWLLLCRTLIIRMDLRWKYSTVQYSNLDAEYLHLFLKIGKNNSKRYCLSFKTVFLVFQNVFISVISNPKLIIASVLPVSWLQYLTWAVKVQMPKMSLGRRN